MVLAGSSGTGKSTFLNTLFDQELDMNLDEVGQVRETRYLITESGFDLTLTVVDTPQLGSKIDNQYGWMPLVRYIDNKFRSYMLQEEQPNREQLSDERVHVCVYFLPPNNQLSPLDVEAMREISKRVNLIPVIGRSDTLNRDELVIFKTHINDALDLHGIRVCKFLSDGLVVNKIKRYSPYAIIGSNMRFRNPEGRMVRARQYHWGMVEVENPAHCDFLPLKAVLITEHMLDLITSMEIHYNDFRQRSLRQRLEENGKLQPIVGQEGGIISYMAYKMSVVKIENGGELYEGEEERIQERARKLIDELIQKEEQRFREWKSSLLTLQTLLNKELDDAYKQIKQLERELVQLNAVTPDTAGKNVSKSGSQGSEDTGQSGSIRNPFTFKLQP